MKIHRVRGLISYSFLLETDDGLYVADAGFLGQGKTMLRLIAGLGRSPDEIRLALITHGHVDHYGGLAELQDVASFDVLVHPSHCDFLTSGGSADISPGIQGWAKGYEAMATATMRTIEPRPIERVVCAVDGMRTDDWGLPGAVIFTPGHTEGDISLVLDSGDAFVGDIVQGRRMPFLPPELPAMATDTEQILESWGRLLDAGATHVWPAHGSPVPSWSLRAELTNLQRKARRAELR